MITDNIRKILFGVLAVGLLAVLFKFVWDQEQILKKGKDFNFKIEPFDPSDPFRGKYLNIRFSEDHLNYVDNANDFQVGETVIAILKQDELFANVIDLQKTPPLSTQDYIYVKIKRIEDTNIVYFEYPFSKYFFEESKSDTLAKIFQTTLQNTDTKNYAIVTVKDGKGVMKDIYLDNQPIQSYFK
jgi:uncharacterized membrane-anchored protein